MFARRPLIGIVLVFMVGTWCGLSFDLPAQWFFIAAWVFLLLTLVLLKASGTMSRNDDPASGTTLILCTSFARYFCLLSAVLLVAWASAAIRSEDLRYCPLASLRTAPGARRAELTGVIAGDPAMTAPTGTSVVWQFTLKPESVRFENEDRQFETKSPVMVRMRAETNAIPPRYGDRWQMRGSIRTDGSTNAIRRPRYFLNTNRRACRFLAGGNGNDFVTWCYEQRRAVSRYLSIGITDFPQHVGLLNALILGYRQDLPSDMKTDFALTGTLHIIAISGSHIVVMAGILLFILQMCGISRMHWAYFIAPLLVIYTVAIGMPASAVRATVMAIIYYSAPVLRRKPDTVSALALAAILVLAVAPGQLFDLGFILSFAAVLGLIVLCPIIDQPLQKLLDPDPLRLQALPERVEVARSAGRYVLSLITLAVSAWLVSMPLTAYYFQRFSLVALPANILVIPLAFFIIVAACLSLMLGPVLGLFADIFNHANLVLITIFVHAMGWMADIPGGSFVVPRPPIWSLVLWYLFLAAVAFRIRTRRKPASPTM